MSSDKWREKYRKALMAQEKLEQRLADEQAKAQKMAMSLTQLAEGKDKSLDERLKAIRVCARNGDSAGMERMMGRADTPLRRLLNYAQDNFCQHLPLLYILTVIGTNDAGEIVFGGYLLVTTLSASKRRANYH